MPGLKADQDKLQKNLVKRNKEILALFEKYCEEQNQKLKDKIARYKFYMTRSEINNYAKENGKSVPEDTRIVVETKEDAELLFKTPVGKDLIDGFKIIRNYPQSVRLGTDYYINVYFLKQNYYAFVKLLAVYEFLSGYQRIILLGFL